MKQEGHWGKFTDVFIALRRCSAFVPRDVTDIREELELVKEKENKVASLLESAQRFYLPNPLDAIKADVGHPMTRKMKLPFPAIAILISGDSPEEASGGARDWSLVVATQAHEEDSVCVHYVREVRDDGEGSGWGYMPVEVRAEYNQAMGAYEIASYARPIYLKEQKKRVNEFTYMVAVVYALVSVLEACNVETTHTQPPAKLQQKRVKKGKHKLLDYHVLSVGGDVWDSPYTKTNDTSGGVRSHLRRGHIRRLEAKSVWVRSTYVHGSKEGFVRKDYEVKGTSNAIQEPQGS